MASIFRSYKHSRPSVIVEKPIGGDAAICGSVDVGNAKSICSLNSDLTGCSSIPATPQGSKKSSWMPQGSSAMLSMSSWLGGKLKRKKSTAASANVLQPHSEAAMAAISQETVKMTICHNCAQESAATFLFCGACGSPKDGSALTTESDNAGASRGRPMPVNTGAPRISFDDTMGDLTDLQDANASAPGKTSSSKAKTNGHRPSIAFLNAASSTNGNLCNTNLGAHGHGQDAAELGPVKGFISKVLIVPSIAKMKQQFTDKFLEGKESTLTIRNQAQKDIWMFHDLLLAEGWTVAQNLMKDQLQELDAKAAENKESEEKAARLKAACFKEMTALRDSNLQRDFSTPLLDPVPFLSESLQPMVQNCANEVLRSMIHRAGEGEKGQAYEIIRDSLSRERQEIANMLERYRSELEEELPQLRAEVVKLGNELAEARSKLEGKLSELSQLHDNNSELKEQYDKQAQELREKEEQLEVARAEGRRSPGMSRQESPGIQIVGLPPHAQGTTSSGGTPEATSSDAKVDKAWQTLTDLSAAQEEAKASMGEEKHTAAEGGDENAREGEEEHAPDIKEVHAEVANPFNSAFLSAPVLDYLQRIGAVVDFATREAVFKAVNSRHIIQLGDGSTPMVINMAEASKLPVKRQSLQEMADIASVSRHGSRHGSRRGSRNESRLAPATSANPLDPFREAVGAWGRSLSHLEELPDGESRPILPGATSSALLDHASKVHADLQEGFSARTGLDLLYVLQRLGEQLDTEVLQEAEDMCFPDNFDSYPFVVLLVDRLNSARSESMVLTKFCIALVRSLSELSKVANMSGAPVQKVKIFSQRVSEAFSGNHSQLIRCYSVAEQVWMHLDAQRKQLKAVEKPVCGTQSTLQSTDVPSQVCGTHGSLHGLETHGQVARQSRSSSPTSEPFGSEPAELDLDEQVKQVTAATRKQSEKHSQREKQQVSAKSPESETQCSETEHGDKHPQSEKGSKVVENGDKQSHSGKRSTVGEVISLNLETAAKAAPPSSSTPHLPPAAGAASRRVSHQKSMPTSPKAPSCPKTPARASIASPVQLDHVGGSGDDAHGRRLDLDSGIQFQNPAQGLIHKTSPRGSEVDKSPLAKAPIYHVKPKAALSNHRASAPEADISLLPKAAGVGVKPRNSTGTSKPGKASVQMPPIKAAPKAPPSPTSNMSATGRPVVLGLIGANVHKH